MAAALTGSPLSDQFSEITDAYAAKHLSESTMGLIVDDSLSSKSVGRLTIRQFNNLAKGTLTHGKKLSRSEGHLQFMNTSLLQKGMFIHKIQNLA